MKKYFSLLQKLRPFCLPLFLIAFMPALGWAKGYPLRYEDLPVLIAEKNGAVQSSAWQIQAGQQRQGYLKRSFLPQVQIQGGAEYFKTGNYSPRAEPYGGAEVEVNLYQGGRDKLEEASRLEQTRLSRFKKEKTFREELSAVRLLYWELIYQREKLQSFSEMLALNRSARQAAQLRAERGLNTDTDALAIDLFQQQVQEEMESARHEIKLLQKAIAAHLGFEDSTYFETPSKIKFTSASPDLKDVSVHPEVAALDAESKINQIEAKRLQRHWIPSVDLYGKSYLYTLQDREYESIQDRFDHGVGVQFSSKLFDRLNSKHEAQSKQLQAKAQEQLAQHQSAMLQNQSELAQEELKHIGELVQNSQKYIAEWRKILQKILGEYNLGLRSTAEVLDAIERLLNFKKNEIERKLTYQKMRVKLSALRGE